MNYKCLCLFLLGAAFVSTTASSYDASEYFYYDDILDEQKPDELPNIADEAVVNKLGEDNQKSVENEAKVEEPSKDIENLEDYQFEDNRSKDKVESEENIDESLVKKINENASDEVETDFSEPINTFKVNEIIDSKNVDDIPENNQDKDQGIDFEEENGDSEEVVDSEKNDDLPEDQKQEEVALDYALLWGDTQEQEALNKINGDEKKILEETQAILEADNEKGIDLGVKVDEEAQLDEKLLEETRKILEETNNSFENSEDTNDVENDSNKADTDDKLLEESRTISKDIDNNFNDDSINKEDDEVDEANSNEDESNIQGDETDDENNDEDEESADKVFADLNADLDKLFETIDKLQDDGNVSKTDYKEEMFNDALNMDPLDYEEKYGKPYREGLVLSFRDDYDNVPDTFDNINKSEDTVDESLEPEVIDKVSNDTELDDEPFPDDGSLFMDEIKDDKEKTSPNPVEPLVYENDAFVDDNNNDIISDNDNESVEVKPKTDDSENDEDVPFDKINVDNLSSAALDDLTDQFAALHKDELESISEYDSTPVYITLNVNEPVVITSPNYPNAYPTNNVIDWVFQGEGAGIELNITDLVINSAFGDYLLVKPGSVDESGEDGLLFAYRLNTERRFRFTDVNRMFVRFESKPGTASKRGFQFSVKMISPLQEPEEIPEPEPIVKTPTETFTLTLEGLSVAQFNLISEDFRLLIADMGAQYISDNGIDPGFNSTVNVTQIMNTAPCYVLWPGYEQCAVVTFGIPLWYEDEDMEPRLNEEDLRNMWRTYNNRDPFALRLSRMGITEFLMPNDRAVLTVWLLIGAGVIVCMMMLAVALWRYSCSENYTRMRSEVDTDSLRNEKRGLDLYPTPHQTLPPLYSENDYKWTDDKFDDTRVDMGGFANKSYARDDLCDFESDEDVIIPRDSNNATKEKDFIKNV